MNQCNFTLHRTYRSSNRNVTEHTGVRIEMCICSQYIILNDEVYLYLENSVRTKCLKWKSSLSRASCIHAFWAFISFLLPVNLHSGLSLVYGLSLLFCQYQFSLFSLSRNQEFIVQFFSYKKGFDDFPKNYLFTNQQDFLKLKKREIWSQRKLMQPQHGRFHR